MNEKPILKYFTGNEADQFTFYRIPKQLFTSHYFSSISTDAKVLYGLMLDRIGLSIRNSWMDEDGHAYVYFSIEEAMELLNCRKNKAIQTFAELDNKEGVGLIEKKRQGQGKPTRIYVKSFFIPETAGNNVSEKMEISQGRQCDEGGQTVSEVGKTNFLRFKKQTSGSWKNKPPEVGKTNPNNNDENNTEENDIKSDPALVERIDVTAQNPSSRFEEYAALIRRNIEYEALLKQHPFEREMINELYELILDTVMTGKPEVVIARSNYPADYVRARLLKLDFGHMEYVLQCLKNNTTKVRNIRQYMLAALFNAPTTISNYYQQEVNYDMNHDAAKQA